MNNIVTYDDLYDPKRKLQTIVLFTMVAGVLVKHDQIAQKHFRSYFHVHVRCDCMRMTADLVFDTSPVINVHRLALLMKESYKSDGNCLLKSKAYSVVNVCNQQRNP